MIGWIVRALESQEVELKSVMMKAGTAQVDVSPREPVFLWGYPHVERISTGIHDPLYATAMCLDDGQDRIIAVSVDVLYVDIPLVTECRRRIEDETGMPGANILISATHTHSGPVTCDILAMSGDPVLPSADPSYLAQLADGIVDAGCRAVEHLVPAEVAVTTATVDGVGCNRLSPDAVRDPDVGIVVTRRVSDRSIMAVQMLYSMHPTVLHEDSTLVSSDFPAYTRLCIQEAFRDAAVIYHNGPCGNQSPRYHVKGQTFDEAERLGRRLGDFVVGAVRSLSDADFADDVAASAEYTHVQLLPRAFPPLEEAERGLHEARGEYERLKREKAGHGPVRTAECTVFGAEEVVTMARAQADGRLAPVQEAYACAEVQVLRIGDTCLVGLPGECFVEYALRIKERASTRAFVVSMANGHLQGYITTPEARGYEANLSMFRPESGSVMVDAALELIAGIEK